MNLSQIRQEAAHRLQGDGNGFRKLILIHTAVTVGMSLLLMLITYLSQHMAPQGGLSNMDTQILLETGQTLLQLASLIIIPFWNAGLIFCAFRLVKGKENMPIALTEGFRRWAPIASSILARGVSYLFAFFAASFASSILISALPQTSAFLEELNAFIDNPTMDLTTGAQMLIAMYLLIYTACLCFLLVPKLYLHRQTVYWIMDDDSCGGLQAMVHSSTQMKGHRRKLFLLDLSFWWFYLLEIAICVLSAAYLFLPEAGAAIPYADWIFPTAALLVRLGLYYFAKPKLAISYVLFYRQLLEENQKEPEPAPVKRMPWKY